MPHKDIEKRKAYNKEYYQKNKEKGKAKRKEYEAKNKEKIKAKASARFGKWYEKNKEKVKARSNEWYHKNKEKVAERAKEYYLNNKDKSRISHWKQKGIIDGDFPLLEKVFMKETNCWICGVEYCQKRFKCLDHDWDITDDSNPRYICCHYCNINVVG